MRLGFGARMLVTLVTAGVAATVIGAAGHHPAPRTPAAHGTSVTVTVRHAGAGAGSAPQKAAKVKPGRTRVHLRPYTLTRLFRMHMRGYWVRRVLTGRSPLPWWLRRSRRR